MLGAPMPRPELELEFDKAHYIIKVLEKYRNDIDDSLFDMATLQLRDLLQELASHKCSTKALMNLERMAERRKQFIEGK